MEQSEVTQSLEEQTSDTWRYVEYIESMEQQCLSNNFGQPRASVPRKSV